MVNPINPSSRCENVFEEIKQPVFPRTRWAIKTIDDDGVCEVTIGFSILESSEMDFFEVEPVEDRCKIFTYSAVKALKNSKFKKQSIKKYCYHTFVYDIE